MSEGYIIKAFIPVDVEEPFIYKTKQSALEDMVELESLQPENRYELHKVEDTDQVAA